MHTRTPPWKAYLNTAGSGLISPATWRAVRRYLSLEEQIGSYYAELDYAGLLSDGVYQGIARMLNCHPRDIALCDSATRAWHSVVSSLPLGTGCTVWTTPYEWAGNLLFLHRLCRASGCTLREIPVTGDGDIDLDWCQRNIGDDVALISITHIPSCGGMVAPLAEFCELVRHRRTLLAVDACQSAGLVPIDLAATPVDLLTVTGKKALLGTRGTGFAVTSARLRQHARPASIDVHTHELTADGTVIPLESGGRIFELGEKAVSAVVGLDAAVRQVPGRDWARIEMLTRWLLDRVRDLPGVRAHTTAGRVVGIVALTHERIPAEQLWRDLRAAGVAGWLIHGEHTPGFLLRRGVQRALRLSIGPGTTFSEVRHGVEALESCVRRPFGAAPRQGAA